jgi:hypothetical protein
MLRRADWRPVQLEPPPPATDKWSKEQLELPFNGDSATPS